MENRKASRFFKRTVLVVDDERINRQMLGTILEQEYTVLYAENGKDALEQLRLHADSISLVLLDLLMPEVDGYEVLNFIEQSTELKKIPVIVLTSEKSAEIRSLKLGAADFLTKPYDMPEVILARVHHSIKLFEDAQIIQATEIDLLTRLFTPKFFMEYGHQYDTRHPDSTMDAVVIDFSRFHMLNELHGKEFGNKVLCLIADGIREFLDKTEGIACRQDADVFYVYTARHDDYTPCSKYSGKNCSLCSKQLKSVSESACSLTKHALLPLISVLTMHCRRATRFETSTARQSPSMMPTCTKRSFSQPVCSRISRWQSAKNSSRSIFSQNTTSRVTRPSSQARKHSSDGFTQSLALFVPTCSFPSSKKTVSSSSLTATCGRRPPSR
ncbi:MAG: response regulator [Treponema sp.]|nr:response regulator [Treponema sp.]